MKIAFGPFILDIDTRQVMRGEGAQHLSRKAFDLLVMLVLDRPNVVTKAELQERLWPATFVDEANLANLIAEIRQALGDHPRDPSFIRTIHRVGYAFCAEAETRTSPVTPSSERPACWLEWGTKRFLLTTGDHLIGRDADVAVSLEDSTVSRRHARLTVTPDRSVLRDLASKNGTFHNGTRVTVAVVLANGDTLGFGSLVVTFRIPATSGSTETQALRLSP